MNKKHGLTAACLTIFALTTVLPGCTDITNSSAVQTPIEMEASESVSETSVSATESYGNENFTNEENNNTAESSAVETSAPFSEESSALSSENAHQDDNTTIGDTGMTAEEWCTQAQQIYTTAASTYFTYLCSSDGFTYDSSDVIEDNWMRVTSCNTLEEATAEYYSVFAQTGHETDLDGQFRMVDDKLYRLCSDRGADISYVNSKVTALTSSTSDTLTFTVVSTYQFPDETEQTTQEEVFTLVFERSAWRVGQFTMPY